MHFSSLLTSLTCAQLGHSVRFNGASTAAERATTFKAKTRRQAGKKMHNICAAISHVSEATTYRYTTHSRRYFKRQNGLHDDEIRRRRRRRRETRGKIRDGMAPSAASCLPTALIPSSIIEISILWLRVLALTYQLPPTPTP